MAPSLHPLLLFESLPALLRSLRFGGPSLSIGRLVTVFFIAAVKLVSSPSAVSIAFALTRAELLLVLVTVYCGGASVERLKGAPRVLGAPRLHQERRHEGRLVAQQLDLAALVEVVVVLEAQLAQRLLEREPRLVARPEARLEARVDEEEPPAAPQRVLDGMVGRLAGMLSCKAISG